MSRMLGVPCLALPDCCRARCRLLRGGGDVSSKTSGVRLGDGKWNALGVGNTIFKTDAMGLFESNKINRLPPVWGHAKIQKEIKRVAFGKALLLNKRKLRRRTLTKDWRVCLVFYFLLGHTSHSLRVRITACQFDAVFTQVMKYRSYYLGSCRRILSKTFRYKSTG